jgi:transcriptional regulator with XRE-family HTH domain
MPRGYPKDPKTLGEHLRRRRLDLGLRQRDLAERWGLRSETVAGWERGLSRPSIRQWPKIIELLGFDPLESGESPLARLEAARRRLGLTRREFAAKVGLDEGSICHWAKGRHRPSSWMAGRIETILGKLEGRDRERGSVAPSYFDLTRWRRTPLTNTTPKTIGERIRDRRLELGLSQEEAGRRLGVGRGTVYRWERGACRPPADRHAALRRFLEPKRLDS